MHSPQAVHAGIIDFNKSVRMRDGLVRTDLDALQARYAADRADCAHDRSLVAGTAGNMRSRRQRNEPDNLSGALLDAFAAAGTHGRIKTRRAAPRMGNCAERADIKAIAQGHAVIFTGIAPAAVVCGDTAGLKAAVGKKFF